MNLPGDPGYWLVRALAGLAGGLAIAFVVFLARPHARAAMPGGAGRYFRAQLFYPVPAALGAALLGPVLGGVVGAKVVDLQTSEQVGVMTALSAFGAVAGVGFGYLMPGVRRLMTDAGKADADVVMLGR